MRGFSFRRYLGLVSERLGVNLNPGYSEKHSKGSNYKPKRTHQKSISRYQLLSAITRHERLKQNRAEAEHASNERSQTRAANRMVGLTVALAFVGAASAISSVLQWCAIKGQLEVMQADQRPWIQIKKSEINFMKFDSDTVNFSMKLTLRNTGKTPATGIEIVSRLYAVTDASFRSEDINENAACTEAYGRAYAARSTGFSVFPDDVTDITIGPTMQVTDIPISPLNDGRRGAGFMVLGCIDYLISSNKTHGQTGFRYLIGENRGNPDVPYMIYASPRIIGPNDSLLGKDLYGNYAK
jgi:hypothetical protein